MAAPLLAPLPEALDIGANYTLRVVAIDPATGNTVPNVKIGTTVLTATAVAPVDLDSFSGGDWFLVPGPNG